MLCNMIPCEIIEKERLIYFNNKNNENESFVLLLFLETTKVVSPQKNNICNRAPSISFKFVYLSISSTKSIYPFIVCVSVLIKSSDRSYFFDRYGNKSFSSNCCYILRKYSK